MEEQGTRKECIGEDDYMHELFGSFIEDEDGDVTEPEAEEYFLRFFSTLNTLIEFQSSCIVRSYLSYRYSFPGWVPNPATHIDRQVPLGIWRMQHGLRCAVRNRIGGGKWRFKPLTPPSSRTIISSSPASAERPLDRDPDLATEPF